jgi:hypothetical protein
VQSAARVERGHERTSQDEASDITAENNQLLRLVGVEGSRADNQQNKNDGAGR